MTTVPRTQTGIVVRMAKQPCEFKQRAQMIPFTVSAFDVTLIIFPFLSGWLPDAVIESTESK
jgi:hypothetical protein